MCLVKILCQLSSSRMFILHVLSTHSINIESKTQPEKKHTTEQTAKRYERRTMRPIWIQLILHDLQHLDMLFAFDNQNIISTLSVY